MKNYLALAFMTGKKSKKETFAGAEYTISLESVLPKDITPSNHFPQYRYDAFINDAPVKSSEYETPTHIIYALTVKNRENELIYIDFILNDDLETGFFLFFVEVVNVKNIVP
jgi:hypothetical protein